MTEPTDQKFEMERKHKNALLGAAMIVAGAGFGIVVGAVRVARGEHPFLDGVELAFVAVLIGVGLYLASPFDTFKQAWDIALDHVPGLHKEGP